MLEKILSKTVQAGSCLEWTGCYNTDGYPRINYKGNCNTKLHRLVYQLYTNEDISGLLVRHKCDNPKCINPEHLETGTPVDNMKDRQDRARTYKQVHKAQISHALALRSQGLTYKEIANSLCIKIKRVEYIINKYS